MSTKSKVFNFMLRNRHILQGKLRKPVFDMNTSIEEFRELCEKGANRMVKIPEGVEIQQEVIAGIHAEWIIPKGSEENKLLFYVHGGGYVSGSCNDHRSFVSRLAHSCGLKTLHYEYRLAPEHPYPAALDDSLEVYKEVLSKGFKPGNIVFAGESAGGGLMLALLLAIRDKSLPLPKAGVAITPWTDLSCSSESYKTRNRFSLAPTDSWIVFRNHYVAENDLQNPYISPLFGDLQNLPPLFINAGDHDELYDDSRLFAEKAKASGVDVTFRTGKGQVHCYPLMAPLFPEATEAMEEIVGFIKNKTE